MANESLGAAGCLSCGSAVEPGDAYCWWCGARIEGPDVPARALGPPPPAVVAGEKVEPASARAQFPWKWVLAVSAAWLVLGFLVFAGLDVFYRERFRELQSRLSQEQSRRHDAENQVVRLSQELQVQVGQLRAQLEQERQVAQRQRKEAVGAALFRAAPLVFGPRSGGLRHNNEDDLVTTFDAGVALRDFVAEATFFNPYDFRKKDWTYGFGFRDTGFNNQYRLFVYPYLGVGRWELKLVRGDPNSPIFGLGGDVGSLNLDAGAPNTIRLVADGAGGELYVNGWHIATLDLSGKLQAGGIWVGTGFYKDTEITGQVTRYESFVVRRLP